MRETSILSLKKILELASVICYCIITLNGEYGVSVFTDIFFRIIGDGFFNKILSLMVLFSLTYLIVSIFKKNHKQGMVKRFLIGLLLTMNLVIYCIQPQEHANPLDFKQSFIWLVFLFLGLYATVCIVIYKEKQIAK